jgi:hypothetical protein
MECRIGSANERSTLQLVLIYFIVCLVPLSVGTYLLLAPRRGGNFLNDAFAIGSQLEPGDRLKNLFYRVLGIGLIAASSFLCPPNLPKHRCTSGAILPKWQVTPGRVTCAIA